VSNLSICLSLCVCVCVCVCVCGIRVLQKYLNRFEEKLIKGLLAIRKLGTGIKPQFG